MYLHRCLENIKKLYTSAGKCNDQQQYIAINEAALVYTTQIIKNNSPISPGPSKTIRNPSARKSLRLFTEFLDVKNKTAVHRLGAAESNHKAIIAGSMFWSIIPKKKVHTKINEQVKNILKLDSKTPQVIQFPISNDCLKFSIYGHY